MRRIFIPTTGPHDWQWLLAKPGLHWKHGASAMALADAWEAARGWPPEVAAALGEADFQDLERIAAFPEYETPLPGGARASQTDLLVFARRPAGTHVVIAVEGKVDEPFGEQTVDEWRHADAGAGRELRLAFLLDLLGLADDAQTAGLHYQLLHRTGAALVEAERVGARDAIMLVHSFSSGASHFDAFASFCAALGTAAEPGSIGRVPHRGGTQLHLGWVTGPIAERTDHGRLGHRFERAVGLARTLHAKQKRKGGDIPYVAHLLAVASLVIEDGGDEDEAIAALLHDAVEDQGGAKTLGLIRRQFGSRVAGIVESCSDTDVTPKPPWRERKQAYLAHLAAADRSALRVSLADKLHNARAILADLREVGGELWSRFNASKDETLWYYDELAKAFEERAPGPLARELRRTVDEIRQIAE